MVVYLAYQFSPRQLTRRRLSVIIDELFEEWTHEKLFSKFESKISHSRKFNHPSESFVKNASLLHLAAEYATFSTVKNFPTLEVCFRYKNEEFAYCPKDFSGLNILSGHSGSEGIVDLIKFAPVASGILSSLGMKFEDLSNLELD